MADATRVDFRCGVTGLLAEGERVIAAETMATGNGIAPGSPERSSPFARWGAFRMVAEVLFFVLMLPLRIIGGLAWLLDIIVSGIAARGSSSSYAALVYHGMLGGVGTTTRVVAVTDRRLLVCSTRKYRIWSMSDVRAAEEGPLELRSEIPRDAVVRARVGWHRLNPKRLRIDFSDGSWTSFTNGLTQSGQPLRAIAEALRD